MISLAEFNQIERACVESFKNDLGKSQTYKNPKFGDFFVLFKKPFYTIYFLDLTEKVSFDSVFGLKILFGLVRFGEGGEKNND